MGFSSNVGIKKRLFFLSKNLSTCNCIYLTPRSIIINQCFIKNGFNYKSFSTTFIQNSNFNEKANIKYDKIKKNLESETIKKLSNISRKSSEKTKQLLKKSSKKTGEILEKSNEIMKNKVPVPKKIKNLIPDHENIYTVPNFLTMTRIVASPFIGYLIVQQQTGPALALFTYSCITDFVDGYIARKYNMGTVVGSVIDPMADKSLMMICTVCLAVANQIPLYIAVVILGRDIALGISAIFIRFKSLSPPKTLVRYFDFSIPSAEVHPTTISKYNTMFQMLYLGGSVIYPVLIKSLSLESIQILDIGMNYFGYFVATTTILSGLSYIFSKTAVKYINKPQS